MSTIGFDTHNHDGCITRGVTAADEFCRAEGLQLTPVRRRVLEILLADHRALGAYDILETLRHEGLGSQPPVAYRALDFLVKNGFAHKIERLNAFVACAHPCETHAPAFLICRGCSAVAEANSTTTIEHLGQAASDVGFTIDRAVIEAMGHCPKCLPSESQP